MKALQGVLRSIPSSRIDPLIDLDLRQHLALGSRVLLAFQKMAGRQADLPSSMAQLEAILAVLTETFDFPLVLVEQHDTEAESLRIVAAHGIVLPANHPPIQLSAQQTLSGTVLTTQNPTVWAEDLDPLVIPQLASIECFADSFKTVVSLPLIHAQNVLGVLTVAHPDYRPIAGYVLHWLKSIAAPVAAILAQIQASQRQHLVQERLNFAALGLRGIIYDLQIESRQMQWTEGVVNLLGYDETEITQSLAWWLNRVHPDDQPKLKEFLEQEAQHHREFALTYRVRRKNDQYLTVCDRGIVLRNAFGNPVRLVGTIAEQTYLLDPLNSSSEGLPNALEAEASLMDAASLGQPHPSVLDRLQDVIFQTDGDGRWTFLNPAWTKLMGFSITESLGQPWHDFIHPEDSAAQQQTFLAILSQQLPAPAHPQLRYVTKAGELRWVEAHCQPLLDANGLVAGTTGILYDITNQKSFETQLLHDVMHDSLTGLPNRVLFTDRLQHVFQNYQRHPEAGFAVLFLDLDRFKVVNDSLGHIVGDELLKAVAERLHGCLRPGDTVARLGGDEFTVLLPNVVEVKDAVQVSDRILNQFSQPFNLPDHELYTSVSIGIALSTGPTQQPDELLRNADLALYRAKENGKGRYELFAPAFHVAAVEQLELEIDLRRALEQNELILNYQPIHRLPSQKLAGFDVLLYWNHPKRGRLTLSDFLNSAETAGLVTAIGWWTLRAACEQLRIWQQTYPVADQLFVSVNLFPQQVEVEDFVARVLQTLSLTTLPSHCLMLGVGERLFSEDVISMTEKLQPLRDVGIYLCLDAFGRRFSAFGDLSHLPVSHLRIHRSFISEMQTGNNLDTVTSILSLGRQLGLRVIAVGIETEPQLAQLQAMKCDYGQGKFLSPISSPSDLLPLFEQPSFTNTSSMGFSSAPTLIVHTADHDQPLLLAESKSWSIGRSSDSTVVLSDRWVSRNHAEIQLLENGDYYLVDLGSGNGSFVNGQRVTMPVLLKHGDLLTIGRTEMEFQRPPLESTPHLQSPQSQKSRGQDLLPKTVLILQASRRQGDIWRAALKSQGMTLLCPNADIDLQKSIEQRVQKREPLPDLLLLDMTALRPNPYSFCRWCHSEYPQLKIILTSGTRTEVPPSERQWAIHQGAVDLLAAFPEENLFSSLVDIVAKVRAVLNALETHPVSQQSLASALMSIQTVMNPPDTVIGTDAGFMDAGVQDG